jgi:class 3 adenylate cyclase
VNVAGRIEGLTKSYRTPIIISSATRDALVEPERVEQRHLGEVQIRGKAEPVVLYEVIDRQVR